MGYTASAADDTALVFLIGKTDDYIKNYCNIDEVPRSLEKAEADAIATEFLMTKALHGGLDGTGINVKSVASVTEGDASVSYATGEAGSLDVTYQAAKKQLDLDMLPFRELRW